MYFTAETMIYHSRLFLDYEHSDFVGASMTLTDIMVFSGTIVRLFPVRMEKNQCQLEIPGVVAYLVKTV